MQHWESVEAFIQVIRQGSFAGAARQLQVSNSHVSRLVSQLELQLGTQLLYRTTRQIRLTDAGQVYFDHCCHLFDGLREAELLLHHYRDQPSGLLKITAATTFGDKFIAPVVNDFQLRYPQLKVSMYFSNRQVELIEEGFDVGIRMGVLRESTLVAKRLCDRREYIVGSPAYFRRSPAPQSLAELDSHNCLVGTRGYWLLSDKGQRKDLVVRGNWQANSGPALLDAALKGIGLAQLPDYYVDEFLGDGRLQSVLEQHRYSDTGVWVVYPQQRHLAPKVRLFIDFLVERFAGGISDVLPPP
ncbi:LysR substrate-binding domain-containing protein [Cellvibrio japonicus]|uniref:Transcriptional regulator, LysR family n=1 Tax=Cellvibrio japonicus (strain Ueda107) TaxID=498211 RepID=B3PF27_CELJU|nr:LysR substrate-binding domain-containing protein [Cellvibrio japonicus]ACE84456.1 transcriptional regulator, LysR family [Cellvibrio japonicus Ueda107]QEI13586.1 LysR family transcriptional regulator [Cellvibrio japonicus]QEI17160.1 LysR family transcriptional regulator [Cellvibrio japonicus]QEI20737.1 LysR family transcriptional regulator [Cellvibrio japonicus]